MSSGGLIHFQVFVLLGGGQRLLFKESLKSGTHGHDLSHSDSLHSNVFSLRLSGSRFRAECETNKHHLRWI